MVFCVFYLFFQILDKSVINKEVHYFQNCIDFIYTMNLHLQKNKNKKETGVLKSLIV